MKRPQYVFRPNLNEPQHRRAWALLQQMPPAKRKEFLVQSILAAEQTNRLEKSIRKVVREELQAVNITAPILSQPQEDIIPDSALDFLSTLYATVNSRRGRVGKRIAHTLTTGCRQGTLNFIDLNPDPRVTEVARCVNARVGNGIRTHRGESSGVLCEGRIRRLTPRECLRLQGWADDRIDTVLAIQSDNQAYKQAGNGVTVHVVEAIGRRIAKMDAELRGEALAP